LITVDVHGENAIVVYPGANGDLALMDAARSVIQAADVVLVQLEIPMSEVVTAARLARGTVIVNAAPARSLSDELVDCIDVLVVNEHERDVVYEAGNASHIPVTITTVGPDGADVAVEGEIQRVPAPAVNVIDTTGAGDTFCGALAEALDRGEPIIDAVGWAAKAGALSTTALGARTAMPSLSEMLDHFKE
jgi:ribokinase